MMAGRAGDVSHLLNGLSTLSVNLAGRKGDIDRLIAASDTLSKAVDDRRQALGTSLDGLAGALDALSARRDQLTSLIDGVKGLSDHLVPPCTAQLRAPSTRRLSDLQSTVGVQVLNDKKDRINIVLDQLPNDIESLRKVTKQGAWINVYTIGFPGTPYVANAVDLGDNNGRNPAKTGGLPQLWFRPPPHDQSIDVAGIKVDTTDKSQPAPPGLLGQPMIDRSIAETPEEHRSNVRRLVVAAVIGAFGIASLGLWGVPVIANPLQPKSLAVTADFPQTIGLYAGSKVLVQGVAAGSVSTVKSASDRVRVTMQIHDVNLDPNAIATIRLRSLIGSRYVELSPVWSGQGPKMADGTHIPLAHTVVPAEVSDFTDETSRIAREIDAQALGRLVHELGTALEGNGPALAGVTSGMAQVSQTVAAQAQALDDSLLQLQRVIGTVAAKDEDVARILRSSTAVSQALLAQQGSLDAAVSGLDKLLGTLTDFSTKEKDKIVQAVHLLATTGKQLSDHAQGWARIVDNVPYYAYGWYNAIHHDGSHWFFMEQISGIMFLPYPHQLNEGGGPGAAGGGQHRRPVGRLRLLAGTRRRALPGRRHQSHRHRSPASRTEHRRRPHQDRQHAQQRRAHPRLRGRQARDRPPPDPSGCNQQHNIP